jgi:hypothetical protein
MSDSENNQRADSGAGDSDAPHNVAKVEETALAPDAVTKAEAGEDDVKIVAADSEPAPPARDAAPQPQPRPRPTPRRPEPPRPTGSTALVLARPQLRAERPEPPPRPEPAKAAPASSRPRILSTASIAAMVALAAVIGGLAGPLATAGIAYLTPKPPAPPANNPNFAAALGRVDRDLAALKTGIDSSARATSQQVAKLADRMDRAEKVQADANAKLARATDGIDRVERRLALASAPAAAPSTAPATTTATATTNAGAPTAPPPLAQAAASATEVTGAIGEARAAAESQSEAKRSIATPSPLLIVDGWTLRDVYRGAAMIQGTRGGVIEVFPGDQLPALGRIEQIKRQDGRWVVVTSRGLIVAKEH